MLKSHEKFHSKNGKRQILVADDEQINREILGAILSEDYEVLFAEDGEQALQIMQENGDTLSLVLLDLMMPVMSGLELLKCVKGDPVLQRIPVIVLTSDQPAEIESLGLGAIDFIPKPYPQTGVILARVLRTIELSEDRQIIQHTERDSLTGLYTREYFFRYAEQYDRHHKDADMDCIVIDVNHFHMINERYGKAYGDKVLNRIGERLREMVSEADGIVCRHEADMFMIYCPHRTDYKAILDNASLSYAEDAQANNRVRLRMGVYPSVDKTLDIERRFDHAKIASDTVRGSFTKTIAMYDSQLHESELYQERLIEDFHTAIREEQFSIFYQPKFYVRSEIPELASAEALVRWKHPELGMISPGLFIPLFENNGLIQQLDNYVWRQAAAQVHDWKTRLGISVPVSVNVSRIDMYDPDLVGKFRNLLEEYDLKPEEFRLEITESAYTQDSQDIIDTVNELRDLGFRIEMDDFGTGYSSLNMISTLPIDALKLDMKFIRNAFRDGKDTRLIEIIIDIADYLSVPVIAEGVETEEQLNALKAMGCDIVQGYYFSKPLPAEEYEVYVAEKKKHHTQEAYSRKKAEEKQPTERAVSTSIAHALTSGFECIYYVDVQNGHYVEFSANGRYEDLQIERGGTDFFDDVRQNIPRLVHPDDRDRLYVFIQKDALLSQLVGGQTFTMTYRIVEEGKPVYYNLRAVNTYIRDNHHIVIGVSNIDAQMRQAIEDMDAREQNSAFVDLACALSSDFESIYYVDLLTNDYTQFTARSRYQDLKIQSSGHDFFSECQRNIPLVVYRDDQRRMAELFSRESLEKTFAEQPSITVPYRLMIENTPVCYQMKIARAQEDANHIVIGVSSVSTGAQIEETRLETHTYARLAQALSKDYFSIYLVDMDTDEYTEYSSDNTYKRLNVERSGRDFFETCCQDVMRHVCPEDTNKALAVWDKARLLPELEKGNTVSCTYRHLIEGTPVYINCKVLRMADGNDDRHIIIGVSNVDAQMKREQELLLARERANRDPLTGVKSKHFYVETETEINREIADGTTLPFAIAVCDVNGLKLVNDTYGHEAGDKLIKDAAMLICNIFDHSPVFRYGGDEFVVILKRRDFEKRSELMRMLKEQNETNAASGGVVIASGLADFVAGQDKDVASVFKKADVDMYENKRILKNARGGA